VFWYDAELEFFPHISDIYVCAVSYAHNVAQKGYFLAMVSTLVETDNPEAELQAGLSMLGPVEQK